MATNRPAPYQLDESRFEASKTTLLIDRFMNHFIKIGGFSIVTVVLGIFVFIFWQILPLFQGAKVQEKEVYPLPAGEYLFMGSDEYLELLYTVDRYGTVGIHRFTEDRRLMTTEHPIRFKQLPPAEDDAASAGMTELANTNEGEATATSERVSAMSEAPLVPTVTAISATPDPKSFAIGTSDGRAGVLTISIQPVFEAGGKRRMEIEVQEVELFPVGEAGLPVLKVGYAAASEKRILATFQQNGTAKILKVGTFSQMQTLFGEGEVEFNGTQDISEFLSDHTLQTMLTNRVADALVLADDSGQVTYLFETGGEFKLRQQFRPFDGRPIASMNFLFGEVSLILTDPDGHNVVYSLYVPEGGNKRIFGKTKTFPALAEGAKFFSASQRNKSFLIGSGNQASLRYATTERVLWQSELPDKIAISFITPKYDHLLFMDESDRVHVLALDDPHPNGGWKALFGKVWYEGANKPAFSWQSTGGTDDFEPKLSLIPLIIGTLKGTLYAMLFAVPIALMAALYVSQFTADKVKQVVKPTMEIMASLPSVVLGFLAALWLAPLIEDRVPSVLLILIVMPLTAFLAGMLWLKTPTSWRNWMGRGNEWWIFLPVLLLLTYACWNLGPVVEQWVFAYTDPVTGERVAKFSMWWTHVTGADYQQRNSLVVGFVMGFAVIPIIFTIAEDALSNVPETMKAGSLALGASRWQTAIRIVVPTASAGIFSALMIGLGRAVGETMIVVMATGNTPIMDMNIFSGMRTLSANIAVELPEAPHHGTLYRALFLGAMTLFLMTFLVNTGAEILRQHLREKYKTV